MKTGTVPQVAKEDDDEDAREKCAELVVSSPFLISVATFLGAGSLWKEGHGMLKIAKTPQVGVSTV
jgi:hypothetical protein